MENLLNCFPFDIKSISWLSGITLNVLLIIQVSPSSNLTSYAVPFTSVRPPPDLVTCTSDQVGAAFDGVGCAVFQNVVCAHVGPPLYCRTVGAVGVLDHGEGSGKGKGGARGIRK